MQDLSVTVTQHQRGSSHAPFQLDRLLPNNFGVRPLVRALFSSLTVLIAPFLGFLLFVMSNNSQLMGNLRNTWWKNVIGALGFVSILTLSGLLVYELLG